jgi:hypothetical protein
VFATNQNYKVVDDVLYKSNESIPIDGTLKCVYARRKVKVSQLKGKYAVRLLALIQAIWLKGI